MMCVEWLPVGSKKKAAQSVFIIRRRGEVVTRRSSTTTTQIYIEKYFVYNNISKRKYPWELETATMMTAHNSPMTPTATAKAWLQLEQFAYHNNKEGPRCDKMSASLDNGRAITSTMDQTTVYNPAASHIIIIYTITCSSILHFCSRLRLILILMLMLMFIEWVSRG